MFLVATPLVSRAADELPPRAVAQLGRSSFYQGGRHITCAAISSDGRLIASAGTGFTGKTDDVLGGRVCLWDGNTGELLRELEAEDGTIYSLAFSPDGKRLAVGCRFIDAEGCHAVCVAVFETARGKKLLRIVGFESDLHRVRFSSDGKQLHVNERLGDVTAWDAASGKKLFECRPPHPPPVKRGDRDIKEYVVEGLLSPDGKTVAWRMEWRTVKKEGELPFDFGGIGVLESPILRVHDAATGKLLFRRERQGESFDWLCYSADSRYLAANCFGYHKVADSLLVWETATGNEVTGLKKVPDAGQFALSADASSAAIEGRDKRIRLWSLKSADRPHDLCGTGLLSTYTWPNHGLPLEFSADGKRLIIPQGGTLRVWDAATGKEFLPAPGHRQPVSALAFSGDGKTLVSRGLDAVCRWDVSAAKQIERFVLGEERARDDRILAHSPDGRLFVDAEDESQTRFRGRAVIEWRNYGRLRIRETATGRVVHELDCKLKTGEIHLPGGPSYCFTPDGALMMVVRNWDERRACCEVFHVADGKHLATLYPRTADSVAILSHDGRTVASIDDKYAIHLYDTATGKQLQTLAPTPGHPATEGQPGKIVFSPDDSFLASAPDGTHGYKGAPIRVYHVPSGREVARFFVHPETEDRTTRITSQAFSPDNRLLAVGVADEQPVRLIEIASGKARAVLGGHRGQAASLAFSPDGSTLASGGADNVIFLWDATGVRTRKPVAKPGDKELAAWWNDLADSDTARAAGGLTAFIQAQDRSVAFLMERLRPVAALDRKHVAHLLTDLDGDTFEAREAASRELARLGELAEAALREAMKGKPSAEAKRRLEELLDKLDRHVLPPEILRGARAVEALEHIGTPDARKLLEALANGDANARQTRDAKAALRRLQK
jgi:WD40 repeat protein